VIPISQPYTRAEETFAVIEVLESGYLAQGAKVKAFEERFADYCGVKHAIATTSGTTALWVALLSHGIGPGDEVITSPFTFIASANAILYTGATPVFADIDPVTFNLDPACVEEKITERTKAIMPVHLFGYPCDMLAFMEIARRHGLAIIEDACQAHGAAIGEQRVGSFGTGCFSFYATKNITTGEGGMITTNDDEIADLSRLYRAHGMRQRYLHEALGYNFRMTDIQAAIGLVQMDRLPWFNERRRENAAYLMARLADVDEITLPAMPASSYTHVYHQFTIRIPKDRDRVRERLQELGVGTGIYYPIPVHKQPLYQDMGYSDRLPVSEQASQEVLSLPVHPSLTYDHLDVIAKAVKQAVKPKHWVKEATVDYAKPVAT
jgi:dTDP-4-amino-4,6-dideoxygalactose transaminase